jgi:hypothetical protein
LNKRRIGLRELMVAMGAGTRNKDREVDADV